MVDIVNFLNENKEWLFDGIGAAVVIAVISGIIRTVFHWLHKQKNTEQKMIQVAGDYGVNTQAGGNVIINNYDNGGKKNV